MGPARVPAAAVVAGISAPVPAGAAIGPAPGNHPDFMLGGGNVEITIDGEVQLISGLARPRQAFAGEIPAAHTNSDEDTGGGIFVVVQDEVQHLAHSNIPLAEPNGHYAFSPYFQFSIDGDHSLDLRRAYYSKYSKQYRHEVASSRRMSNGLGIAMPYDPEKCFTYNPENYMKGPYDGLPFHGFP